MIRLSNVKMKSKLTLLFLLIGVTAIGVVGTWSAVQSYSVLRKSAYEKLNAVREIKKNQINKYFAERRGDMGVLVETVSVLRKEAFDKLKAVQSNKKDQLILRMKNLYTVLGLLKNDSRLNDLVKKYNPSSDQTGIRSVSGGWNTLVEQYDAGIQMIVKQSAIEDILLIHLNGDIIYTASKKADLGMNIEKSSLAQESIGKAFTASGKAEAGEIVFSDIALYSPFGGMPAAFLLTQLRDGNNTLQGFVGIRISSDLLNDIMMKREGMGQTGESYLVGKDGLMRSDSYLNPKNYSVSASFVHNNKVETEAVRQAMSGQAGQNVIVDYNGNPVLSCWDYLDVGSGVRWAVISEMDVAEAFCPIDFEGNEFYKKYKELYGYEDLYLIDQQGYVFYSAEKGKDYLTHMLERGDSRTHLAALVNEVIDTGTFGFADFQTYSPKENLPCSFIAQPVLYNGSVQLVVALQLSIQSINSIMQERTGMGDTGETYLVGQDLLMRSDSYLDQKNHTVLASFSNPVKGKVDSDAVHMALKRDDGQQIVIDYNGNPVLSSYAPINIGRTVWAMLAEIDEEEINRPVKSLLKSIAYAGALILLIVAVSAIYFAKQLAAPLALSVDLANDISEGDLSANISIHQKDEIGMLAEALKQMVVNLLGIIRQVRTASENVNTVSQALSSSAQEVSQGAAEQAASAEEVSSSVEQMASNISQNADNAAETERIAVQAAADADKGRQVILQTTEAMKNIADKISIIEEIARQTDLLALNAAIEAARAGDHGKGFAVVASEVRKLSEKSQTSAKEISQLSLSSVFIAENAGAIFGEIVPNIKKTAELVQEISAACSEQTVVVSQVNKAVQQLDTVIQQLLIMLDSSFRRNDAQILFDFCSRPSKHRFKHRFINNRNPQFPGFSQF